MLGIEFNARKTLKAQTVVNFVVEMTLSVKDEKTTPWTIFIDGSSDSKDSGAGVIIEKEDGLIVKVSSSLSFTMTNNTAEYEVFLACLRLAKDMGAKVIKICIDSKMVAFQV